MFSLFCKLTSRRSELFGDWRDSSLVWRRREHRDWFAFTRSTWARSPKMTGEVRFVHQEGAYFSSFSKGPWKAYGATPSQLPNPIPT